jgi:hypothetical protein
MPRLSIRTVAVFAVVFLAADDPWLRSFVGSFTDGLGGTVFVRGARAETGSKTDAEKTARCVLPGEIRPLGPTTYITRGRIIKTTKKDCETRAGRLVAPSEPGIEMPSGESAEQGDRVPPKGSKTN